MFSLLLSTIVVILCGGIVQDVYSWGAVGHGLVARLAQSKLTDEASEWVKSLVPWYLSGNLTAVAAWADDILYPNTNSFGYPNWQWSRPLHYINTPSWSCNYDPLRDCKNDVCIDGALRNYSKRAIAADLDDVQHQEALMFLVHYVGDVHQPLHAGFQEDRGGNSVEGYFMNRTSRTNLHSLWDSGLISIRLSRDFGSSITRYYEYISAFMLSQTSSNNDDDFNQWIRESSTLVCQQIYLDENNMTMNSSVNFTLGNIYYQRNIGMVEQRIVQGGRRLSALFNRLAANRPTVPSGCGTLCSNMTKLIVLISIISKSFLSST